MATARRPLVLVVEDEWLIADQIGRALSAVGFDVLGPVGRARAALALLATSQVDAALLDINVHGERSFAVAERLAETSTPFIFLSGYSNVELPTAFSDRPLMQKPVDIGRLCLCLRSLIPV